MTIKGIVANPGKYTGIAKIIGTKADLTGFKKGEIFVAHSINPGIASTLKKAGAIITDESGLTSHAAIISKEKDIPCLVGTRNATLAIRSGDKILVNAVDGWIKIL
ncbi:MAG TPA: PEP-utilizing enzyme [Patescibacteria group bacterium]|nr:PEP-utilizing enzyme [Patescibacteria group bacterium]